MKQYIIVDWLKSFLKKEICANLKQGYENLCCWKCSYNSSVQIVVDHGQKKAQSSIPSMYTNWRWKFLSQNNPVLIRSMRRFNIWVKKGFFNHFPNSKQLFPCSLVYMWFALICSFTLSLSVHVISCIQLLVDDVISLQRSLKLSIYFFPSDHMFPQLNSVLQTPGRYMLIPFLRKFWKLYYQHLTYPYKLAENGF